MTFKMCKVMEKLNFQHQNSSIHCHMILQKSL